MKSLPVLRLSLMPGSRQPWPKPIEWVRSLRRPVMKNNLRRSRPNAIESLVAKRRITLKPGRHL
jgi:hypothetical protein